MAKDTCEEYIRLSIFRLKEWGYLNSGYRSGTVSWENGWGRKSSISITLNMGSNSTIRLTYKSGEEDYAYDVRIVSDDCRFGGKRYWFICPLTVGGRHCGRRCAMLYGGRYFGCRKCHDLAYSSQQVSYSGALASTFMYLTLSDKLEKKLDKMRVKFWRGRPTKRYARLLPKMDRIGWLADSVSREIDRAKATNYALGLRKKK